MRQLEAISKGAAIVSVLALVVGQLLIHPDTTWVLAAAGVLAFVVGLLGAHHDRSEVHAVLLFAAPVAPAILLRLTGRETPPLLDFVWMAGIAGFVVRANSWSQWAFPPLWSILLGGWAATLAFTWPVVALREIAFDPRMLRDSAAVNSWAGISAPHVVGWTLYVVAGQLLALLWFDWAYRACTGAAGRAPRPAHGLWAGITVASVVAIIQGTVDLEFLNTPFWAAEFRAAGTMLDANAYGIAAACAGPLGFVALGGWRRRWMAPGAIVLGINWAGAWMSGSRTGAILCGVAGAIGIAMASWHSRRRIESRDVLIGAGVAAAALIAVALSGGAVGPFKRLMEIPLDLKGIEILVNREDYGPIAHEMIREHPLTGVGVGSYHYLAPDYQRLERDQQLPFDNAQNWWRHQMVELGILGSLPVVAWSAIVAWTVIASRPKHSRVAEGWVVRALLAGLGVTSLFGMPTQNPVVLLLFFLLVAMLAAVASENTKELPLRWQRVGWIAAIILAVAETAGQAVLADGPLSVAARAARFRRPYITGTYEPERLENGERFRWTGKESRFVLPVRNDGLTVRLWAFHPDIHQQPVRVLLASPCGVLFERELSSTDPITLRIAVPETARTFDASLTVSRTWSPADAGGADTRQLGVGVQTDPDASGDRPSSADFTLNWPGCPRGLI